MDGSGGSRPRSRSGRCLDFAEKCPPGDSIEGEHRTTPILGVPYRDRIPQNGDFDAIAIGTAFRAGPPDGMGKVGVFGHPHTSSYFQIHPGAVRDPGYNIDYAPADFFNPLRNERQADRSNVSIGPLRSLESRTAITPSKTATSTQAPLPPLFVLVRQTTWERSARSGILMPPRYPTSARISVSRFRVASGLAATARRCSNISLYLATSDSSSKKRSTVAPSR